jgi:hypothetical protein
MRPVDMSQLRRTVPRAIFDEFDKASRALAALETDKERRDYIKNGPECSAFQVWLWRVGFLKCWYSEVKLQDGEGQVEHFRPKLKVWKSKPPHGGYTWLAFDWHNFRLAHPSVNKRRADRAIGSKAGKGCYFPLREEDRRARVAGEEDQEEPVLLDPIRPSDCLLLCFEENSGKPVPRFSREKDEWRHRRAAESINYYHLDEGTWNAERADLMRAVSILCQSIEAAAGTDQRRYEELVDDLLTNYVNPYAEFSRAAEQIAQEKGLLTCAPVPRVPPAAPGAGADGRG